MNKTLFLPVICLISTLLLGCSIPESTPIMRDHLADGGVYAADISQNAEFAVFSAVDTQISVWSLNEHRNMYTWRHQEEGINLVDNVHISADGTHVVTADSDAFAVWNMANGEPVGFWRIDASTIRDIAISNGGRGILVGRANGAVMFFEPDSGRRLEFIGHQEKVNSVDITPNGKYALTGSNDYKAYLWSTETGQVIHVFNHPHRVSMVSIDDKGRYLFTSDSQDEATIWDAQSGKAISSLQFIQRQIVFTSARFSEDGRTLLTGSPAKRLSLWDVATGKQIKQWRVAPNDGPAPQSAVVYAVGYTSEGVASLSSSGNLEFWHE